LKPRESPSKNYISIKDNTMSIERITDNNAGLSGALPTMLSTTRIMTVDGVSTKIIDTPIL
jgi:hypothetical protein